MSTRTLWALILLVLPSIDAIAELEPSDITQVVMLGTGTPNPDPERSGPAVTIVVHGTPYLVDFGPGVVRRASAMSPSYGGPMEALEIKNLRYAFLTHLHSDHTAGLSDLILTPEGCYALRLDGALFLLEQARVGALPSQLREELAPKLLGHADLSVRALATEVFPVETLDGRPLPPLGESWGCHGTRRRDSRYRNSAPPGNCCPCLV